MHLVQHVASTELSAFTGWVAPSAVLAGVALLIVALFRRTRATLARKRRTVHPGTGKS
ncbi:hypothetical protein IQ251_17890 [Saccharopolyspora sp. HNM0983]|uniref:Uncharacterized protein n=1 Tax=Saccharopolyspora montiporae TaxID=2781240 RepID=A0A929G162_9PSEU|nr:hypothetical protein [Saccharopolyspora sp. HNM0983]MBE9376325.1 hypothetical protein [Saccharopolyspora sp. HNM0983]